MLRRYAASSSASSSSSAAAPAARLDLITMSFIGKPRVSSVAVSDLRPARQRFGMVNYVRTDAAAADARRQRRWWHFAPVIKFNVQQDQPKQTQKPTQTQKGGGGVNKAKHAWVWTEIAGAIAKRNAAAKQ